MYGYYADVANECQIFHICYPVTYADGIEEMLKWSFICPAGTIFDQVISIANNNQTLVPPIIKTKWGQSGVFALLW